MTNKLAGLLGKKSTTQQENTSANTPEIPRLPKIAGGDESRNSAGTSALSQLAISKTATAGRVDQEARGKSERFDAAQSASLTQQEQKDEEAKASPSVSDAGQVDSPAPAQTAVAAAKPATKLGGLKVATVPTGTGKATAPSRATAPARMDGAGGGSSATASLTLDQLAESEDPGSYRPQFSQFADETPADKPLRDLESASEGLDEEIRKGMAQFAQLIDGVYSILDDPEMLGNVIRSIMIELKSQPQYMKLVADDDIRMWIRAMRENMGLQKIAKETKKTTRKSTSSNVDMDMLADLESFGDLE